MDCTFVPPRCPNRACSCHREPKPGFCRKRGSYQPRCRHQPVPRFECRECGKSFSRQTFRHDRGDRRPDCNELLFLLLVSGTSLRQSGRVCGLDIKSVQMKFRKLARTCSQLHENHTRRLPDGLTFLMDEEETYESASIRPLTMPVLIEKESWFIVATATGSIRRLAPEGTRRRERQRREEMVFGVRRDESNACVRQVLQRLRGKLRTGSIVLRTDMKTSYAVIARTLFGDRIIHERTSSKEVRSKRNPLFPINNTLAMSRDNCGRLRRRSWLVSKRKEYLQAQLHLFTVYRNYVRRRFNRDHCHQTSAWHLKLLPRQLFAEEVAAWRQDWGGLSISPLSRDGLTSVA